MKTLALILLLPGAGFAVEAAKTASSGLAEDQRVFYAVGQWLSQKIALFNLSSEELKSVEMGLKDGVQGRKPPFELESYVPKINEMANARMKVTTDKEKAKAAATAEKYAKEKGARSFASGLIYIPLKEGKGASPKATDTVKVHYEGTLTNGTVFDSSIKRGSPAEFPLNGVIPCWTEGVQMMKVGAKAKLVCPSTIAYGDAGHPPAIPGGATLVFEVELLEIKK